MKKLITLAFIAVGFTAFAQEAVSLMTLGSTDTISVMETAIYKIDNETGDSTSTVQYYFKGQDKKIVADSAEAWFVSVTDRLITPSGLGYTINADRIEGINRLTDSTCTFFYLKGNARVRLNLGISAGEFQTAINGL